MELLNLKFDPTLYFLFLVCAVGCQQTPRHTPIAKLDSELPQLTAALDAADTQGEMNDASGKIAEFWDAKLASIEKQLTHELNDEQRKQFADAKEQWQNYRAKEVDLETDLFAGGSIQPLIANETYSEITQSRVAELEGFLEMAQEGKQ